MKPLARKEGLVVTELPDELLVYDLERHRAHCLNASAALVFEHSDGKTDAGEMARLLRRELKAPADDKWVWLALDRLGKAHLLQERVAPPSDLEGCSRRALMRSVGAGIAVLLPIVASLTASTAEAAVGSCIPASSCTGAGTPARPCYGTVPAMCDGFCTCTGAGTCDIACS